MTFVRVTMKRTTHLLCNCLIFGILGLIGICFSAAAFTVRYAGEGELVLARFHPVIILTDRHPPAKGESRPGFWRF